MPKSLHLGHEYNLLGYRILTARCAGYLEFGTLNLHIDKLSEEPEGGWREHREHEVELERFFRSFPNHVLAKDLFFLLENYRIELRIQEEYPGVKLDMKTLGNSWRPKRPNLFQLSDVELLMEALYQHMFLHKKIAISKEQDNIMTEIIDDFFQHSIKEMTVDHVAEIVLRHFWKLYSLLQKARPTGTALNRQKSTSKSNI